ncbi:nuclear transcription factor Y subunit B-3-like [Pyrus x bretschneideri]|uniref:nuclear transcription factor Y subunit B-3-like n=1 Tax=Pyrus x bretschneideri TaxID=225117 RepID=UPI0020306BD8|nr:nuclear transcription factor Y subunit B-3-like [Pyrus x bretschneideri]
MEFQNQHGTRQSGGPQRSSQMILRSSGESCDNPDPVMNPPLAGSSDNNTEQRAPQCLVREQDRYMPIANVIRIMRRILPPHAKISDDAKETMQECVSEYIAFITGEANERCQREQRKTVTAEDVLWAMGKLGFDNYVEPLTIYLQRYRESESSDRSQFVKREERQLMDYYPPGHAGQVAMMPPPPPSYGPGYYFGPQHGPPMYDPSMMGMFRDCSSSGDGGGGSSSASGAQAGSASGVQGENSLGGFDPFGHFK